MKSTLIKNLKTNTKEKVDPESLGIIDMVFGEPGNEDELSETEYFENEQPTIKNKNKKQGIMSILKQKYTHIVVIVILFVFLSNTYIDSFAQQYIPYFNKAPSIVFFLVKVLLFIIGCVATFLIY